MGLNMWAFIREADLDTSPVEEYRGHTPAAACFGFHLWPLHQNRWPHLATMTSRGVTSQEPRRGTPDRVSPGSV